MLWGTGTSILGTSISTQHSCQCSGQKWNTTGSGRYTEQTKPERDLLIETSWEPGQLETTSMHLPQSSQYFDQNIGGILSKFKIFKDNSAVFSAISSWFAKKTVRLLAHPRCHADKLVLILPGKSQLRLSVSFPLQFVPEKACQQAQSRGPAKIQTCPVGCSVHLTQS